MLKPQRTNRLSSVAVFRVVYLLFVSQINSTFFTFADAVQQTDNEGKTKFKNLVQTNRSNVLYF